jgi:uncharacterized membrane protein YkoI
MVALMNMFFSSTLLTLLLVLCLTAGMPVMAAPDSGSAGISQQQAAGIAQSVHPGRVLSVKQSGTVYRVKTLSADGEVRIIVIDASSGKVISGR